MGSRIVRRAAVALCAIALPIGLATASVRVSGPHLPMPRGLLALVPPERPVTAAVDRTPTAVATETPTPARAVAVPVRTALVAHAVLRQQATGAPGAEPAVRPVAPAREPEAHADVPAPPQTGLLPHADVVPASPPAVTTAAPPVALPEPPVAVAAAAEPAAAAPAPAPALAAAPPLPAPAPASSPAPGPSEWTGAGDDGDREHGD